MENKGILANLLAHAVIEMMKQKDDLIISNTHEYEFKVKVKFDIENNTLNHVNVKKIGFKRV